MEKGLQTQIEQGSARKQGLEGILHYLSDHLATSCHIYKAATVTMGQQRDRATTF
jgi:hypothetical protein